MSIAVPKDAPAWVDGHGCKACSICVSYCPAGVLTMCDDAHAILGQIIEIVHPESCIGCTECKTHCPDSAIMVAKRDEFKFTKLTPEAKDRAVAVKNNRYKKLA